MIKLISPINGECVSLHTPVQKKFLADEPKRRVGAAETEFEWFTRENSGIDQSCPAPVVLTWDSDITFEGLYIIIISENSDLSEPIVKVTDKKAFDCYNLCIGTKYYWCVQKEGERSDIGTFCTADEAPRFLKIGGLGNIRDCGGYDVPNGRVRQGLVFRGSEADSATHITEDGVNEFLRLGIRTEIDLRSDNDLKNNITYGAMEAFGVKRYYMPVSYRSIFDPIPQELYRKIFTLFTDKDAYPFYLHCVAGADRTGTVVFILGAFLGVPLEKLLDDLEFSSLGPCGYRSRHTEFFQRTLDGLKNFKGNTLQEQATDYLKSHLGLSDEQLDDIRNILLETK